MNIKSACQMSLAFSLLFESLSFGQLSSTHFNVVVNSLRWSGLCGFGVGTLAGCWVASDSTNEGSQNSPPGKD